MPGASDVKAGRAYVEISANTAKLNRGLNAASQMLKSWGRSAAVVGGVITGAGLGVYGFLAAAVKQFASVGSELKDMATRTGVSATALAELGYAARQTGAELGTVEVGIKKMQKALGSARDGSAETNHALAELGLTIGELEGKSPDKQFETIGEKIAGIEDPSQRAAAAMKIFGRSGTQLLPMLAELRKNIDHARELHIAPTKEEVETADRLSDAMKDVVDVTQAVGNAIGYAVSAPLLKSLKVITKIGTATIDWARANGETIRTVKLVAVGLIGAGGAITALGLSLAGAGVVLGGIASGFSALAGVLAVVLSPLGLITAALVGGAFAWAKYTASGKAAVATIGGLLGNLSSIFKDTFSGITAALSAGELRLAAKIAMAGLKAAVLEGLSAISNAVGGAVGDLLGAIGAQLVGGDFAGAWETAITGVSAAWNAGVSGMAGIFDGFCDGVISTFTQAVKAVTDLWKDATQKISDYLLEDAKAGGFMGTAALLGTGVDVNSEQGKAELIRRREIQTNKNQLRKEQMALDLAKAGGHVMTDEDGQTWSQQDLETRVSGLHQRLKELGENPTDVLGDMKAEARKHLSGTADSVRDAVNKPLGGVADSIHAAMTDIGGGAQQRANAASAKFRDRISGGAGNLSSEAKKALDELAALQGKAVADVAAKAAKLDDKNKEHQETAEGVGGRIQGTFSAAALLAAGGGGSPQQQLVDLARQARKDRLIGINLQKKIAKNTAKEEVYKT